MAIKPIPRSTNNTDYNIKLRDLANLKGLDVGYNQDTKSVSVGGQPFDTTGWQNIGGYHMGTEAMGDNFLKNYQVPTGNVNVRGVPPTQFEAQTPNARQDPTANIGNVNTPIYPNEINNVTNKLGNAVNNFGQPYDLSKDPIYEQLAKYQQSQMLQMAGRRGLNYSDTTTAQIGQANMQLGLQFQDRYDARQLQNIQNLQGQLNTLTGLEDRAMVNNTKIYGMALTPKTNDYMTTMQNLTPEQTQYVSQYSDNFAAEINNLPAGDPRRKLLEAGRFQKVIGDPVAYRDYLINDYGLSPFQVDNIVMNKKIAEMQAQATNEKEAMELQKLMLQVEKAYIDNERAGVGLTKDEIDAQKAYWDSLSAEIKASALPQQFKADLLKTNAEINNINASAESSRASSRLKDQELIEQMNKYTPQVQGFLTDWLGSGLSISNWLNQPDAEGNPIGRQMPLGVIQALIEIGKDTGEFSKNNTSDLAELNKLFENLGLGKN